MILFPITAAGQLNGRMAATTPCGMRSTTDSPTLRASSDSATNGARDPTMAAVAARSNNDSTRILPCSRVRRAEVASRSIDSWARWQASCKTAALDSRSRAAQGACAPRAAATALSSWSREAAGASRTTSSGWAGFLTG